MSLLLLKARTLMWKMLYSGDLFWIKIRIPFIVIVQKRKQNGIFVVLTKFLINKYILI